MLGEKVVRSDLNVTALHIVGTTDVNQEQLPGLRVTPGPELLRNCVKLVIV